jgi:hypothetical protein
MRRSRPSLRASLAALLTLGTLGTARAHEPGPGGPVVGDLSFADPAPGGIGYEWTLTLHRSSTAELVGAVGAKSWNEPSNPEGLKGWTHTSNWIALDLPEAVVLKIRVVRQQGVVTPAGASFAAARAALVPALSLYRGWDDTTEVEEHIFNSTGNFWSTVEYVGSAANPRAQPKVAYRVRLAPGRYSIDVGGNPRSLGEPNAYPAEGCDPIDPTCYAYTGTHGYRAIVSAR